MLSLCFKFCRLLPLVPATSLAWVPGVAAPSATRGFEVDSSDRAEVVSFYHAVFRASEGYEDRVNWTGVYNSTAAGAEGTTSAVFVGDVERRLNYFRAMAGVRADVQVNSGSTVNIQPGDSHVPSSTILKSEAAQRSALMIIRTYPNNGGLSHDPPQSNTAWTKAAWNANHNGSLALGFFGPGAVTAYMKEDVAGISSWNFDVGHRRWMLYQWGTDYATGDTPGSFSGGTVRPPTNVTYVIPKSEELDFSPDPVFASYPASGFFPAELNSPYWSLAYPDADFTAATVTMKDSAMNPVSVSIVSRATGFGDNAIVWQVPETASVASVAADTTWHITVSGIQGSGIPAEHSYSVTLIDPNVLLESATVSGNSSPLETGDDYQVSGISDADEIQIGMFLRQSSEWSAGAEESPEPEVTDDTSGTYPFYSTTSGYVNTGAQSYRLTFPTAYDPFINGVPEQSFVLNREIVPGAEGTLEFQYRRGLMTAGSKLVVESSSDDGYTWVALGDPISGNGGGDGEFKVQSYNLPVAPAPLRIRFRLYYESGSLYTHEGQPGHPTGIFIDDISTDDCDWLEVGGTVSGVDLASFTFDSASAGIDLEGGQEWWLRARAVFGGHAFPYGAAFVVTPVGALQLIGSAAPPESGASYAFIPDPAAEGYRFRVEEIQPATWTETADNLPSDEIGDFTDAAYSLASNRAGFVRTGSFAFRLGLSNPSDEEDFFMIDRTVLPSSSSELRFWTRRGRMSPSNRLHIEVSVDDGFSWESVWNLPGRGGKKVDGAFSQQLVPLADFAGESIRLRVSVRQDEGGANASWIATASGVWIDDISVSSSTEPGLVVETDMSLGEVFASLNSTTAGQPLVAGSLLNLRLGSMAGGQVSEWGPKLSVLPTGTPETGFAAWLAYEYPGRDLLFEVDDDGDGLANGIEYAFSLNPFDGQVSPDLATLPADRIEISRDLPVEKDGITYGAAWSDDLVGWSTEGVEIVISGGAITASAPKGSGARFIRWVITEN